MPEHIGGSIDGESASADLVFLGEMAAGGAITATVILSNGLEGVLNVDATALVGGTYSGLVRQP